jgi:hypothetical protein
LNTLSSTVVRGLAGGVAASLVAAAVFAGAAAADTAVFSDARGDLDHGADIHRVRVVNTAQAVRVKVTHDDLVRSFRSGSSIRVYLDTDRSRSGPEFGFVGGTFQGSDYALVRSNGWKLGRRIVRTPHELTLDYAKDVAHIRIERGGRFDPGGVRVAVKTGGEMTPDGKGATTAVDWLGDRRELTPWVRRG